MTLLFLRHGIRGTQFSNDLNINNCLTYITTYKDLSIDGFNLSNELGKYINNNYGIPDFIYADVSDSRTVNTAISLAKGCNVDKIWVSDSKIDIFFKNNPTVSKKSLKNSNENILSFNDEIINIKNNIKNIMPCLNLPDDTKICKKGKCSGLLKDLSELYNHGIFTKISNLSIGNIKQENIDKYYEYLVKCKNMLWSIEYPIYESMESIAKNLISGISYFLNKYKLSVLIGHDTNICILSQFLGKLYNVDGYCEQYVPPNSGFIFKKKSCGCIEIKYIYLSFDTNWYISDYINIRHDKIEVKNMEFNLIYKYIGI